MKQTHHDKGSDAVWQKNTKPLRLCVKRTGGSVCPSSVISKCKHRRAVGNSVQSNFPVQAFVFELGVETGNQRRYRGSVGEKEVVKDTRARSLSLICFQTTYALSIVLSALGNDRCSPVFPAGRLFLAFTLRV